LLAFTAFREIPRRVFSQVVTGSMWAGLQQFRVRHRWSMTSPSGIGPTSSV
jgi:hypothetical protein